MTDDESLEPRWKLTCFYMGRATAEVLTVLELRDRWTLVEMGEDINKCEGRQFEDADAPKEFEDCPLDWKDGKATETGCGPWWSGVGRNTLAANDDIVAECDALLVRAGLPKLTVVIVNGVPNMKATFGMEGMGVNADQLDALDRAEWRLHALTPDELTVLGKDASVNLDGGNVPETQTTALQTLNLYVSHADAQPQLQPVPFTATHDDYVRSLSRQALFSGSALDAARHILGDPYGSQRDGLSSVYVDKPGTVHLLRPHGHTVAAFNAIRDNLPEGYAASRETLPMSGLDFRDLTRLSGGIMRGQFYPHGVGMSVDLQHPPTPQQLQAMEDYHTLTSQKTFVAELYDGKTLVGYARNMASLRCVLEKAKGVRGGELESAASECGDVVIGEGFPESVGGRIGG